MGGEFGMGMDRGRPGAAVLVGLEHDAREEGMLPDIE